MRASEDTGSARMCFVYLCTCDCSVKTFIALMRFLKLFVTQRGQMQERALE